MRKRKSIDVFDAKYTAHNDVKSTVFDNELQAGQLETYGDDLALVKKINNETPKNNAMTTVGQHGAVRSLTTTVRICLAYG